ncbi:uncharacterized protein N7482_007573 [Penicillium canariense]|uniref:Uncharacterized protein n=1 Tax=Penicillium canariense TaxID=189055 RepID=A0A9W9HYD4_9EURO|nr:uncharacterized protein N7482_007573 [Penicillium canariense]KAJ5160569.1 hypothetical protein N7482_007573 [Penicillium canariense]
MGSCKDIQEDDSRRLFYLALRTENSEISKTLLHQIQHKYTDIPCPLEIDVSTGERALLFAVSKGNTAIVSILLDKGFDVQLRMSSGHTLLHLAVIRQDSAMIKHLLEREADPHIRDLNGRTPLFWAVKLEIIAIADILIEAGANPSVPESEYRPLTDHEKTDINLILGHEGASEASDHSGQSPLHLAALDRNQAMMTCLLQKRVHSDIKDHHGRTPLFWAVQKGHVSAAHALLEAGSDPNIPESDGMLPIRYNLQSSVTVDSRHRKLELEPRNKSWKMGNQTPLFFAAGNGDDSLIRLLLEYGAEPDPLDEYGETPLLWAAARGLDAPVKTLLDRGGLQGCLVVGST